MEECRLREQQQGTPVYQDLLRLRGLDPLNERRLDRIRSQYQYVQAGLREVDFKLDGEWEEHERNRNGSRCGLISHDLTIVYY